MLAMDPIQKSKYIIFYINFFIIIHKFIVIVSHVIQFEILGTNIFHNFSITADMTYHDWCK